tara:strand:- start:486 stop:935 length:450 start_codon:yes stop_codon:yes gene_type:complete
MNTTLPHVKVSSETIKLCFENKTEAVTSISQQLGTTQEQSDILADFICETMNENSQDFWVLYSTEHGLVLPNNAIKGKLGTKQWNCLYCDEDNSFIALGQNCKPLKFRNCGEVGNTLKDMRKTHKFTHLIHKVFDSENNRTDRISLYAL